MQHNCPTIIHGFKSKNFLCFQIIQAVIIGVYLYTTTIYKSFGSEYISNDYLLTLTSSIGGICNLIGRYCCTQKEGQRKYSLLLSRIAVQKLMQLALILAPVQFAPFF